MITCYLDSQDYSVLTDPKSSTSELQSIADALKDLAQSRQVQFAFSGTAVSEAVALTPDATHLAELKAELLSELCGANALVSFDRLAATEVRALCERQPPARSEMFDLKGRWFPDFGLDLSEMDPAKEIEARALHDMAAMGLSRQQRRARVRTMVKDGKFRGRFHEKLTAQRSLLVAEFMKQYPMPPAHARAMARYAAGDATGAEFEEAVKDSMCDPRWMMKWFTTDHARASPIAELVRRPGRDLGEGMRQIVELSTLWAQRLRDSGEDADPTGRTGTVVRRWDELVESQLQKLIGKVATAQGVDPGTYTSKDVNTCCPGISTGMRALFSSVWENVGGSRKEPPSDSQPVDGLHAFYAPYVDVFRADRFMTPHIQRYAKPHGTIVVGRLTQLVAILVGKLK